MTRGLWNHWKDEVRGRSLRGVLKSAWHFWVRGLLWHRYHVLPLPTLPPTWTDTDRVLLHACFTLLTNFVERERPFEAIDWSDHPQIAQEITTLYEWWTKNYPAKQIVLNEMWTDQTINGQVVADMDAALVAEENEMLHRLIAIRAYLWT